VRERDLGRRAADARRRRRGRAGRRPAGPSRAGAIGSPPMPLDPARTVAELRELQELTGDENGAQRVAWTDTWVRAREWLGEKLAGLPLELDEDEAANQWWTLRGESDRAVLIGGHIDSVP